MINNSFNIKHVMAMVVFAMPSLVSAAECLTPVEATASDGGGFAVAVQADQGQGSIDCSAFIGQSGAAMMPVTDFTLTGGVGGEGIIGTKEFPLRWESSDPTNPLTNIRVLFIGNSGDGSRCTQFYTENAVAGNAGAGTKTNKASDVVACTDGFTEPEPQNPPVRPVSTADGCENPDGDFDLQDAINANPKYDVLIAIGRGDKGDNTAICSDNTAGPDPTNSMTRCVEQCITPDADSPVPYNPDDPRCQSDGPFFPINCRACELSAVIDSDPFTTNPSNDPKFCWEVLQKARLPDRPDDYLPPVVYPEGEFKKAPGPKGNQVWNVREYAGSTCYQVSGTTDYGYRYSYFVPAGCTP
jgi:hypothetical protein